MKSLPTLNDRIISCTRCTRLREYCQQIAVNKKSCYRDHEYWGKPVPNMGNNEARLLLVGLAPGAHGSNRTGQMFTGDRSGEWLFQALYDAGFATSPNSITKDDGFELIDTLITATCHCAPPGNKPTNDEITQCFSFLEDTIYEAKHIKVILGLGKIGFDGALQIYAKKGIIPRKSRYPFSHFCEYHFDNAPTLMGSYHPSQQNTFTGKLTREMLRDLFKRVREIIQQ